jgi:mRNA interferase RelE/StbE
MQILFSKTSIKNLNKYDAKLRTRIISAIEKLPHEGDIKKIISEELPPLYRLRVRDYRIIYQIVEHTIKILKIDNRGDIYKNI